MTEKLSDATRGPLLGPLKENGWVEVEGRDAIAKTFVFDDFGATRHGVGGFGGNRQWVVLRSESPRSSRSYS